MSEQQPATNQSVSAVPLRVIEISANDRELVLHVAGETGKAALFFLRLTSVQDHAWRLQSAVDPAGFDDMGAAQILARDLGEKPADSRCPIRVIREETRIIAEVLSSGLRVLVGLSPLSFDFFGGEKESEPKVRISSLALSGADFITGGPLAAPAEEAFYGGGERFNRANQRGKCLNIMSIDKWCGIEGNSYTPVPFVLSSEGYALFLNRYEHSLLDLGASDETCWQFTQLGAPLDFYVFINNDPIRILKDYSDLTGHAPMPASWLFGIQVTRHARLKEFGTKEGIRAMIKKMAENDFPWDAVIAEGWDAYDPGTYDDLREITREVHDMGKKLLLYEGCARVPWSDETEKQNTITGDLQFKPEYLVREPDGNYRLPETATYNPVDAPNPKRSQFIDITNPETLRWWYDFVWGRLVRDMGVDGCKIDFCEQVPDHIPLVFKDGRSSAGAHLWYPTLYNALMYRYYQQHRPEGGMCFSRGGGIGAQRYPFLWAGDQRREFVYLQAILTSILSSGFSGIPFMSYDMSGYMPAEDPQKDPEDIVFIRGIQMGCYSSNMQTHGIVKRPYDFDAPVRDLYRVYCKIHELLRPYLLEQAEHACASGTPLLRHLFLYDPGDKNVWNIEDEYMLGGALLVAPVFSKSDSRDIYLPRGTWRNILDGKVYQGGQTLRAFPVPLRRIPVFLLEGHDSKTIDNILTRGRELFDSL